MPDIVALNGGTVKAVPDPTDLLPIQDVGGITKPTPISGIITAATDSPVFVAAVQSIVSAMIIGGAGTTVTYDAVTNKITITAP